MRGWLGGALAVLLCMAAPAVPRAAEAFGDAPRITKEEAKALLGAPGVVFLDARTESAWRSSSTKLKGAVRVDPRDVGPSVKSFPRETRFVVY